MSNTPETTVHQNQTSETVANNKSHESAAPEDIVLVNIMEEIVRMEAPKIMKSFDMCDCQKCLCDVMAITLNNIPAKYVVSLRGALFAKIASHGSQYRTDIFSSLTQACTSVKASPSH